MALKSRKVAIVGTGLVGSSTAFSLITQGVCEEILMIDLNKYPCAKSNWALLYRE